MKTKIFPALLTITLCAAFFIASCKKDKDKDPSLEGYWVGNYGMNTSYPTLFYSILFRNDGTVRVWADNADTATAGKAEGTYTVSGSTIKCTYSYLPTLSLTYSFEAKVNDIFTFIEGGWGSGSSTTNGGKFYFVKK